jgi:hypothetical protein
MPIQVGATAIQDGAERCLGEGNGKDLKRPISHNRLGVTPLDALET